MTSTSDFLSRIASVTDLLDEDYGDKYTEVKIGDIRATTEKAALIQLENHTDHIWTPFSVLRCDEESNIYIATWFHNKSF